MYMTTAFCPQHVTKQRRQPQFKTLEQRTYQTRSIGINGDVSGHQANVRKFFLKFSVLLVAESLDRGSVDDALPISEGHSNSIRSHHGFASRGMCRHLSKVTQTAPTSEKINNQKIKTEKKTEFSFNNDHDRLAVFKASDGLGLKGIESEGELLGGFCVCLSGRRRRVGVTGRI